MTTELPNKNYGVDKPMRTVATTCVVHVPDSLVPLLDVLLSRVRQDSLPRMLHHRKLCSSKDYPELPVYGCIRSVEFFQRGSQWRCSICYWTPVMAERPLEGCMGVDRNSVGNVAVFADPQNGKVQHLGFNPARFKPNFRQHRANCRVRASVVPCGLYARSKHDAQNRKTIW
jgi:hypothetical protein